MGEVPQENARLYEARKENTTADAGHRFCQRLYQTAGSVIVAPLKSGAELEALFGLWIDISSEAS